MTPNFPASMSRGLPICTLISTTFYFINESKHVKKCYKKTILKNFSINYIVCIMLAVKKIDQL